MKYPQAASLYHRWPFSFFFWGGGVVCVLRGEIYMLAWSAIQKFRMLIDYIEVPVIAFFF